MLVLPYNSNIEYQKKKFISNIALTELIMKRYLPTPTSLRTTRHIKLWRSLSAHSELLLEPWESPMTAIKLCAFFYNHPSPCCFRSIWSYDTSRNLNYANLAANRVFSKATAVYSNILSHEWHVSAKLFTILHQTADDQVIIISRKYHKRWFANLLLNTQRY